ncbi:MAG: hypothetical protein IJ614_03840 [Prevotella sp.]|nr:hypothetical protein [Prevotella sp.]
MKNLLFSLAILALGMTTSCSSDDGNTTNEDTIANAFFASELPLMYDIQADPLFLWNGDPNIETCKVINSAEELRSFYRGNKALPAIDFSKKSLVIGWKLCCPVSGVEKVEITEKEGLYMLDVTLFRYLGDGYYTVALPVCYWGVFPKITTDISSVNMTVIEKER